MSAFCVYGMTITHTKKLAEKRLERVPECKTKEEWKEKVRAIAEVILTNHLPVQAISQTTRAKVLSALIAGRELNAPDFATEIGVNESTVAKIPG